MILQAGTATKFQNPPGQKREMSYSSGRRLPRDTGDHNCWPKRWAAQVVRRRRRYMTSPKFSCRKGEKAIWAPPFRKRDDRKHEFCLFPHHVGTYVSNEKFLSNQFFSVPQAARVCTRPLLEACVLGVRQTKLAAVDKTLLFIDWKLRAVCNTVVPELGCLLFTLSFFFCCASACLGSELSASVRQDTPRLCALASWHPLGACMLSHV